MKAKVTSLLVVLFITTISCTAQRRITVEAQNNDISNNLDLQAVASTFGESKDLEDFERRLNDFDSQISNLDLNNDGEVDYLRVIENVENNVHVVVIQAVLDKDVFQDVATIVVERNNNRRTYVQVIGDPYIYGDNYIIEPVYVYTPSIFSFFWGYNYHCWNSPYYYGYYPRYYRYRHPFEVNVYLSHVYSRINHDHRYYYGERRRNEYAERMHYSISRNDYGKRHPEYNFNRRNENVRNKREFESNRANNSIQSRNEGRGQVYGPGARSEQTNRVQDDVYQRRTSQNYDTRSDNNAQMNNGSRSERNTNTQAYPQPSNRQTEVAPNVPSRVYQPRTNPTVETRQQPTVNRESNNNSRPAPVVNQPSRQTETRTVERRPVETKPARAAEPRSESRSSNSAERR
jgi:hypothetical protein